MGREWGTKTIHINFYEANMDQVYNPYLEMIWDIGNTFWQLCETDIDTSNWDFRNICSQRWIREKIDANLALEVSENWPMWPRQLVADVRNVLSSHDIIALDNGLYKVWFARNYKAYAPNTLLLDNALATMWAGVASGLEAKEFTQKNVVVVTGDGGLVMNLWDLETVVRLWVDLTIVVLNNASYGMIKWKQTWAWMPQWWLDFLKSRLCRFSKKFLRKMI